jgi:ABC-type nitrate/sulfonate/bicarbonate transport system substrate-binding protein
MDSTLSRRGFIAASAALAATGVRAQGLEKVRIGQATSSLSFLPLWAGRALGSFERHGVDLDWAVVAGGDPPTLAALDSGDIDFAAVGSETALVAISKGQPFQLVYSLMSKVSLEVVVSNAFLKRTGVSPQDPLQKRIAALADATIGASAVRGAQDRMARWVLSQGKQDPKALKVVQIGAPPALRAAVEQGTIDGFLLSPPEGLLIEKGGGGKIFIRIGQELELARKTPFLVLVAKRPLEGKRLESGVKLVRGLVAASQAVRQDPAAAAKAIQAKFFQKLDPAILASGAASMKDGLAGDGRMTAEGIDALVTLASETGAKIAKSSKDDFWSNALVDRAMKS